MFMGVLDMINRGAANSLVSTLPCKEIRMKMEEAKNEIAESETQPAEIKQEHQQFRVPTGCRSLLIPLATA